MNISKKVKQRVIASTMPFVEEAGRSAHLASQVIQNTVRSDAVDDEKGHWVTTEEGNHMFIDEEGTPTKGNPYVLAAARGENGPKKSKSSGSNRPTPTDHSTVEKNREQRGGIARKMHESGEIPTDVMGQLDSNNYSDKIMDRAVERGWITKEQASKIKGESQPEAAVKAPAKPNKYRETAEKMKKEAEKNPSNLYYSEMVQNYSALADAADKFDPNASEHKGLQTVMALQNAKIGDTVEIKGNLFDGTYRLENVKSPWNNKSGPAWVAQDEKNHKHAFANNPATIMSEMILINGGKAVDDQSKSVTKGGQAKAAPQGEATKKKAEKKGAASHTTGMMGDEDIRENIRSEIVNRKENAGSAKAALSDLRVGDSVVLDAKTYKGNIYKTIVTSKGDGSFELSETIKGKTYSPRKVNLEDASDAVLYFKALTGGALDKISVNRAQVH